MRFLFDNNIPPSLAVAIDALSGEQHQVIAKRDKFPPDTRDTDWLRALGREGGWAFVSNDRNMMKKPHELQALQEARVTAFFLQDGWDHLEFWEKAAKLVKIWPVLLSQVDIVEPGAGFLVPVKSGRLRPLPYF